MSNEQPTNGLRSMKLTIGSLVVIVLAAASIISALLFAGGEVEGKVSKAVSAHDVCAHSHGDIRARLSKTQDRAAKAYRSLRTEMQNVSKALTAQRTKLDLVLERRGRRRR